MRTELARFALVRWPDAFDPTVPCCITLDAVNDAVARGAILVGREWDIAGDGVPVIEPGQSNPRRQLDETGEDLA